MADRLWRLSPRVSRYVSLTEEFTRDEGGSSDDSVSADLFFGPDQTPNPVGAFSVAGSSSISFSSQALVGPPPGLLPTDWFKRDDVLRIVLAEMNYVDQTVSGASGVPVTKMLYLANWPYFDDVNSRAYSDCIKAVPRYNRALDRKTLRGRYTSSIGTLELDNADGAFDALLAYACDGSEIRFYMGDAGDKAKNIDPWLRSQFIFMFSAVVVDVSATAFDRISITLKDTSLLLDNKVVGGAVAVGGTDVNASQWRPKNFGYLRQVECILQDHTTLTYALDETGNNLTIVDVRDKGVSVGYTNNGDGTIRLLSPPAGTVTADFYVTRGTAGVPASGGTPSTLISTRISDAMYQLIGVDAGLVALGKYAGASPNFEFQWTNDYHIGYSTKQPVGTVDVLNQICDTGNMYWAIRRDGYFTYGWLRPEAIDWFLAGNFPSLSVAATVSDDDLMVNAIRITRGEIGAYEIQGYGNLNQISQSDFAGSLTTDQLALYKRAGVFQPSYLGETPTATAYLGPDTTLGDHFGLFRGGAPQSYHTTMTRDIGVQTLISCVNDADALVHLRDYAAVRRAQTLPWLEFIDITVDLSFFQLEIGNVVASTISRFGLNGMNAQVISIDMSLTDGRINLGLVRRRPAITTEYV